jgi:hypothetical protein
MENQQTTPISKPSQTQPLLSLSEVVLSLADVFGFRMTDRAMHAYALALGYRTDEDLNAAYVKLLRDSRFMPKPGEILDACPVLRVRRDGSRA